MPFPWTETLKDTRQEKKKSRISTPANPAKFKTPQPSIISIINYYYYFFITSSPRGSFRWCWIHLQPPVFITGAIDLSLSRWNTFFWAERLNHERDKSIEEVFFSLPVIKEFLYSWQSRGGFVLVDYSFHYSAIKARQTRRLFFPSTIKITVDRNVHSQPIVFAN